jgi:hypothetical protein
LFGEPPSEQTGTWGIKKKIMRNGYLLLCYRVKNKSSKEKQKKQYPY